jgi:DNA ligase-1
MLACNDTFDINKLHWPKMVSAKEDGFRCIKIGGVALSRSLKPIRNKFTKSIIEQYVPNGFDGELVPIGGNFQSAQSVFTSHEGEPEFAFMVFEWLGSGVTFHERYIALCDWFKKHEKDARHPNFHLTLLQQYFAHTPEEYEQITTRIRNHYEASILELEGFVIKDPDAPYKYGRCTLKEEYMLKDVEWKTAEATVIGFEEMMHNGNEATTNELGRTSRSSHAAGKEGLDTLGAFILRPLSDFTEEFKCGNGEGLTLEERKKIWSNRHNLLGKTVTYKYKPHGSVDRPRQPGFKGFRHKDDTGE